MATQRVAYDHARLVAIAEEATASTNLRGFDLACTYVQEDVQITKNAEATFQWSAKTSDYERVEEVRVIARNANNQGVPLPTSWRTVSLCLPLDEMACRSADAERSAAYPELTCEILGMPKPVAVPSTDDLTPGNVVALRTQAGERLDYLLCAHVQNARWLCHRGSFLEGQFDNEPVKR